MRTNRRGWSVLFLAITALVAMTARAGDPNQNRGFSPDKVYAAGDIDSVNVFNGNLILRIPLGQEYSVGPVLRYQFVLTYNSKVWDYGTMTAEGQAGTTAETFRYAIPEKQGNAGFGWTLSLGELIPPNPCTPPNCVDQIEPHEWIYRGPDGSQHEFFASEVPEPPGLYTEDGSFLRLRTVDEGKAVDFPDGTTHTFTSSGLLKRIEDRFGNWVRLTVSGDRWTIEDGFGELGYDEHVMRTHTIDFEMSPGAPHPANPYLIPDYQRKVIREVNLAAFNGTTATYSFEQARKPVGRGGQGKRYYGKPSRCVFLPLLEEIRFPDQSRYVPTYYDVSEDTLGANCETDIKDRWVPPSESGAVKSLTLPTGGKVAWTYQDYALQTAVCGSGDPMLPPNLDKARTFYAGVKERSIYEHSDDDEPEAVWKYHTSLIDHGRKANTGCNGNWIPEYTLPPEELINIVEAPDGVTTKHYFSVYPAEAFEDFSIFKTAEYGLPFTRNVPLASAPDLFLSSETRDANDRLLRETYVKYEYEIRDHDKPRNSRMAASRTIYRDYGSCPPDCPTDYVEQRQTDYDGAGRYRRSETTSSFGVKKTAFVNYTPFVRVPTGGNWLTGLYDWSWQQQGTGAGSIVATKSTFSDDGMLLSVRTLADPGGNPASLEQHSNDLLTAWCRDDHGYIVGERYFGGDATGSLPDEAPCTASQLPGSYFLDHTWTSNYTHHTAKYRGMNFLVADEDYDANTGLVATSRDSAGLPTTFTFDSMSRLASVKAPGKAKVSYAYDRDATPPQATVTTNDTAGDKVDSYYFDGLGRLKLSKVEMPKLSGASSWSATVMAYDESGRLLTTSTPMARPNGSFETLEPQYVVGNTYDALGRLVRVASPDGTSRSTSYGGARTRSYWTQEAVDANGNPGAVTEKSRELYDAYGRLVQVQEPSGANGAFVATNYEYDVADRLTRTETTDGITQERLFVYDMRGFLQREKHPEKGNEGLDGYVRYSKYDARGHFGTKNDNGLVTNYTFDAAERLRLITDSNLLPLKQYEFLANGKLDEAIRFNRLSGDRTYRVAQKYSYEATAGRVEAIQTNVARAEANGTFATIQDFTQTYAYEPNYGGVSSIGYPKCTTGCSGMNAPAGVSQTYSRGALTAIDGFATLRYAANGNVFEVARATPSNVVDRYSPDRGMARVESIQFDALRSCSPVSSWPAETRKTILSGAQTTFTIEASPDAVVQWFHGASGNTDDPITTPTPRAFETGPLFETSRYWCRVSIPNSDCSVNSPTFTAEVCRLPEILDPAANFSTPMIDGQIHVPPMEEQDLLTAHVAAVATGIHYDWHAVRLVPVSEGVWSVLQEVPLPSHGPEGEWEVQRHDATGVEYWGLRVTITGSCATSTPVSRLVTVVEAFKKKENEQNAPQCDGDGLLAGAGSQPPKLLSSIPPERRIWWPSGSIQLDLTLQPPVDEPNVAPPPNWLDEYYFQWFVDGRLTTAGFAETGIGLSVRNGEAKLVQVRTWRECANGAKSEVTERTSYLWSAEGCPKPPLTVDRHSILLGTGEAFHVSSVWRSVDFYWYRGDSGNTSVPVDAIPRSRTSYVPTAPGAYWVRAVSRCGSTADSATLLVSDGTCVPVQFLRQPPAHVEAAAGAAVTLSYDIEADPAPSSVTWTADGVAIANAPAVLVEHPTRTTVYQATVANACSTNTSSRAIVHVTSCADITVRALPQPASINKGDEAHLSIDAVSGHALSYQWYEGESGDPASVAVGNGTAAFVATPEASTKYWVRVSIANGCAIDSPAIAVTVCRPPEFGAETYELTSAGPGVMQWLEPNVTGDHLSYEWFEGLLGDESHPISDGRSIMLRPLQTTNYWLRVTSDCVAPLLDRSVEKQYRINVCPQSAVARVVEAKVMPGTRATLIVETQGADHIEWLDETHTSIGTGSPLLSPVINGPRTFHAIVRSGSCELRSDDVQVAVCDQPTVGWNAVSTRVKVEQAQTLSVHNTTSGRPLEFLFYSGPAGDVASSTLLQRDVYGTLGIHPARTTSYWVRAQEEGGCYADTPARVVEVCVPTITQQPQAFMIDAQHPSATLQVVVDLASFVDPGRLTYQWFRGDSGDVSQPVTDTTAGPSLVVQPGSDTKYWVRVTSHCGGETSLIPMTVDSEAATVAVCVPPQITEQPANVHGFAGQQFSVRVVATGTQLAYQWYQGLAGDETSPISNGTGASFGGQISQTTDYWVEVSGSCGTVSSNSVKVSIAPVITTQPNGGAVTKGVTRTLTVVATGSQMSYQWYAGGASINGATSASYTTPALLADVTYTVRITSGTHTVESAPAVFTVCEPRAIDVQYTTRVSSSQVTLSVIGAAADETFEWYEGASGVTTLLRGSGTYLAINPDVTRQYWVRTKRATCDADSAAVTVLVCMPRITTQPQGIMINSGQTTTLTVAAAGTGPLNYQWYIGNSGDTSQPVSNATAASYTTPAMTSTRTYWVRVTSPTQTGCTSNRTDSNAATIDVCAPPAITQQPIAVHGVSNIAGSMSVTATGTELTYQWYRGNAGDTTSPVNNATSSTLSIAVTQTTDFWVKISGHCGTVNSAAAKFSIAPTMTTQPAGGDVTKGTTRTLSVTATGAQLTYQWYLGAGTGSPVGGATSASYTTPPLMASASYWVRVISGSQFTDSATAALIVCTPRNATIEYTDKVSGSAATLRVVTPDESETYEWYLGTTKIGVGTEKVVFPVESTDYWLRTKRATCDADSAPVRVLVCTPRITTQPQSGSLLSGSTITLSVAAAGTGPLMYQWYIGTSGDLSQPVTGATSASYTTPPLTANRSYWVRVTSPAQSGCTVNSANSQTATVTICQMPAITVQPKAQKFTSGSNATISVTATGGSLQYEWHEGTAGTGPIVGTSSSLTVNLTSTKSYWVRVSNGCGFVDSNVAQQSVYPVITQQPADVAACTGDPVTLTIAANGTGLSYAWFRQYAGQAAESIGGNASSVTFAATADSTVSCRVTSGEAFTISANAAVTLNPSPAPYTITKTNLGSGKYRIRANVAAADVDLVYYDFYRGALGDTTNKVSTSQFANYVEVTPATTPMTYWVRVRYMNTLCATDKAVTVP